VPQSGAQFKFQAEDKWAPEWGLELSVVLLATFYSVYCYCFYFVCCLCWLNCDHTFVSWLLICMGPLMSAALFRGIIVILHVQYLLHFEVKYGPREYSCTREYMVQSTCMALHAVSRDQTAASQAPRLHPTQCLAPSMRIVRLERTHSCSTLYRAR